MQTFAIFKTERANRYLTTLCHHFGRRVKAQCTAGRGLVQFPFGSCEMTADKNRLELMATAQDQKRLDQVTKIVTSHLERFAFRENPLLVWQSCPEASFHQENKPQDERQNRSAERS